MISHIFPYIHFGLQGTAHLFSIAHIIVGILLALVIGFPSIWEVKGKIKTFPGVYGLTLGLTFLGLAAHQIGVGVVFLFHHEAISPQGVAPYDIIAIVMLLSCTLWFSRLRLIHIRGGQEKLIKNRFFMVPPVAMASAYLSSNLTRLFDNEHLGKLHYHLSDHWLTSNMFWVMLILVGILFYLTISTAIVQFRAQTALGAWSPTGCGLVMLFGALGFSVLQYAEALGLGFYNPITFIMVFDIITFLSAATLAAVGAYGRRQVGR